MDDCIDVDNDALQRVWPKNLKGQNGCAARVNFTNILQAAFAPLFFCQKYTMPNCKYKKAAQNTFNKKAACIKCCWNWSLAPTAAL